MGKTEQGTSRVENLLHPNAPRAKLLHALPDDWQDALGDGPLCAGPLQLVLEGWSWFWLRTESWINDPKSRSVCNLQHYIYCTPFTNSQCTMPAAYCVLWSFNNGRKWKRGSIIVKQQLTVIHLWHFTAESTIDYGRKQRQIHYAAHTHISRVLYISCSTLVIQNDQTHAEGLQPSVIISLNVSTDYGEMLLNNGRYGQSVSNILFGLNNSVSVNTDRLLMEHFSSALWRTIKNKKTHLITFRCHVLLHFNSLISIYKQYTDMY